MNFVQAGDGVHVRHIENIELPNDGGGLGFGIVGSRNAGVVIKTILAGGVADKVGSGIIFPIFDNRISTEVVPINNQFSQEGLFTFLYLPKGEPCFNR